jgi:sterol desaturase/sphingolipid hydroxylase (fatty acid hydroxylase superfamily)
MTLRPAARLAYPLWLARGPPAAFVLRDEFLHIAVVYPIATDCWFFVFHKLMHYPTLYKRVHKMHHRFKASPRR